jgi:hypothetical protein
LAVVTVVAAVSSCPSSLMLHESGHRRVSREHALPVSRLQER